LTNSPSLPAHHSLFFFLCSSREENILEGKENDATTLNKLLMKLITEEDSMFLLGRGKVLTTGMRERVRKSMK
jgi:hypothetical protein